MCLTRPARVLSVQGSLATVELDRRAVTVDVSLIGAVTPGEHLLVHAGFALDRLPADVAAELEEVLAEAFAPPPVGEAWR